MKKSNSLSAPLLLCSALLAAGCTNSANSAADPTTPDAAKTKKSTTSKSEIPIAMNMQEQTTFATDALMKKLNVGKSEVKVLAVQSVTWRSSAVGCPTPGEHYMQALVPGTLIVLAANGQHYRYHAKRFQEPFYCEASKAESPATENSDI